MADEDGATLIVRHLPAELTASEQEDLLKHFGASNVRSMGNKGRMKHIAFATFPDKNLAKLALGKLHQLEILGSKLVVEFSNWRMGKFHPKTTDTYPKVKGNEESSETKEKPVVQKVEIDMQKVTDNVNSLSQKWNIQYPLDPRLEYMYPPPTVSIITNIANALASVPRFYVQVLHLMNKMNLPAPFGPITPTPVLPEGEPSQVQEKNSSSNRLKNNIRSGSVGIFEQGGSTEESEIESDGEIEKQEQHPTLPLKRSKKSSGQPKKRQKLIQHIPQTNKQKSLVPKPSEVFEQSDITGPKKIAFHLPRLEKGDTSQAGNTLEQKTESALSSTMAPLPGAPPLPPSNESPNLPPPPPDELHEASSAQETESNVPDGGLQLSDVNGLTIPQDTPEAPPLPPVVVEGGFGKMEPVNRESESESSSEEEENWGNSDFISSSELRKGRISSSEMRDLSIFKKYDRGEPSTRLYIKNIAKTVSEKDLHYIYGRYVNWDKEEHCNMFDIRLMKEGRMKGQAFVTLPSIKLAKDACKDTNGFKLQSKPIVVQFARSAKAKPEEQKDKQNK